MSARVAPYFLMILASVLMVVAPASAQDAEPVGAQSAAEVARELSNPVGSLASLNLQVNYNQWGGSAPGVSDQSTGSIVFLPVLPFKVGSGNLAVRPSFPFAGVPLRGHGHSDELGPKRGIRAPVGLRRDLYSSHGVE